MQADFQRRIKGGKSVLTALVCLSLILSGCARSDWERPVSSNDSGIELQKAQQLIRQGKYEAALMHLHEALILSPSDPNIYQNLGWLYLYTGEYDNAARELEKLIKARPNAAGTLHLKAALMAALGQHKEAVPLYKQALALDEKNERLYFDISTSLAELNQYQEALNYLEAGFEKVPDKDFSTQLNYLSAFCTVHAGLRDYKTAISECTQAAEATPSLQEKQRLTDLIHNMNLLERIDRPASEATPKAH